MYSSMAASDATDGTVEPPCPVECIEAAEERDGEIAYLLKWCDGSAPTWVATSGLEDYGAAVVELVALFEAGLVDAADEPDDLDLEDDQYVIEALIGRRYAPRSCRLEYLVSWKGYGEEEDSWEEAEGLPLDLRVAYDATLRTSTRPQRGRA